MASQPIVLPKFILKDFVRFTKKDDPIIKQLVAKLTYAGSRCDLEERQDRCYNKYMAKKWVTMKRAQITVGALKFDLLHEFAYKQRFNRVLIISAADLTNVNFRPVTISKKSGSKYIITREASGTQPAAKLTYTKHAFGSYGRIRMEGTAIYQDVIGKARMYDGGLSVDHMIKFKTPTLKIKMSINAQYQLHSQCKSALRRSTRESKDNSWKLAGKMYFINGLKVNKSQVTYDLPDGEEFTVLPKIGYLE